MPNEVDKSMSLAEPPATAAMRRFLQRIMPGSSRATLDLRQRLLSFALNPASRTLLIQGPTGAGKSTVARAVAALVRVAMLTAEDAERILGDLKIEGGNLVSARSLIDWYVELPLTGLVESIADVQLFGSVEKAFTGAGDTAGIFERASGGRGDRAPVAAQLTGGVVFLDEVGDVPPALQAKLLAVLSGGRVYRVGAEGDPERAVEFDGTVISATWKSLDPPGFRPDLLARIAGMTVTLPGLSERMEDIREIIVTVADGVMDDVRRRVEDASRIEPDRVDRDYWSRWSGALETIDERTTAKLSEVDWARHGHMRGLTGAIREIVVFREDVATVVERLPTIGEVRPAGDGLDLFDRLIRRAPDGRGVASHLRALALEDQRSLRSLLEDPGRRRRLAASLGITEKRVRTQVLELGRDRSRASGDAA
ncbi:sigma 54-interacting transcriptional regulator [Sphingomonas sp. KRR8]|uniref:sigma 54-interacting transcriptional regulator n=1 Tax=Sphingomonas sp. KRR8 TaxID=2942996 RepID=UPI0020203CE1|nr:sigma 54-interacting transcriptional regulator [Sphingomonas sp. KRR8]URD59897.1 sigma 54-interacting transcriptional regulator [Sphingomonas sp. KRR8]